MELDKRGKELATAFRKELGMLILKWVDQLKKENVTEEAGASIMIVESLTASAICANGMISRENFLAVAEDALNYAEKNRENRLEDDTNRKRWKQQ